MITLTNKEVKKLFKEIRIDDFLDTDLVKIEHHIESALKIGTIEIDIHIELEIYHGEIKELESLNISFTTFNNGSEIKCKYDSVEFLKCFSKIRKLILNRL